MLASLRDNVRFWRGTSAVLATMSLALLVAAIIALDTAYEQYANAIGEYNAAQFDVYHAMGQPAQWITSQAATTHQPPPSPPPASRTNRQH